MGWFSDNVLGLDPSGGGINTLLKDPAQTIKNVITNPLPYIEQGFENLNLIGLTTNEYYKYTHPKTPNVPIINLSGNILITNTGSVVKIPVIYGTRRVGGTIVFAQVSGKDLYLVVVFCEGEVSAINTVYIDDVASTDSRFTSSSPALVHITKYVGTTSQSADSSLIGLSSPTLWASAYQGKGLAYAVIRLTYNSDAFNGLPTITADIDGKKVYDPRDTTTKFSANPALCIRDYLTNTIYGKGLDSSLIDDTLIGDVADDCDITMNETTASPAASIAQFECNVVLNTENTIKDNLNILLTSCHGYLSYFGGTYNLRIEQDESSVYDFTTDNMVGAIAVSDGGKDNRLNRLKIIYTNPDQGYTDAAYIYDSTSLRADDNGAILESEITLPAETNQYRAQWHAGYVVKRSRQQITCQLTGTPEALRCIPGDIVTVTYASLGWSSKTFRVIGMTLRLDCLVDFSLLEHDASIYDRTIPAEAAIIDETTLPDPFTVLAPTGLNLYSGADYALVGTDLKPVSRIYLTFTLSADQFPSYYVVQYKKTSESEWHFGYTLNKDQNAGYISGLADNTEYSVRVALVNSIGKQSAWLMDTVEVSSTSYWTNVTFTKNSMPANANWVDVAWNGTIFCAIANSGTHAATSSDGITWTARTLPTSAAWSAIAWDGTKFFAISESIVGTFGSSPSYSIGASSADGITWTLKHMPFNDPAAATLVDIASDGNGMFVVAIYFGNQVLVSTDHGDNWTYYNLPNTNFWQALAWNGTKFCIVSFTNDDSSSPSYNSAYSPDGMSWTGAYLPDMAAAWNSIASDGNQFIAIALSASNIGGATNIAATSPDGITWTQRELPATITWTSIAWNGAIFCAVGAGTDGTTNGSSHIAISHDGIYWELRPSPIFGYLHSIVSGGSLFVVVGQSIGSVLSDWCITSALSPYAQISSSALSRFIKASSDAAETDVQSYLRLINSSAGAAEIGHIPSGTGAVATDVQTQLRTYSGNGSAHGTVSNTNTASGVSALDVTTGTNNAGFGYQALKANTSGQSNTAIGSNALGLNSTGSHNTAVGYQALKAVTNASNTALGYLAMDTEDYANCTALGANTAVTGSNQVQLGDSSTTTYAYGAVQNRSDARDKTDVRDTELGLNFIAKLRPVDFKWHMRKAHSEEKISEPRNRNHHGLIAQEVKTVCDNLGIDFGGYQDHKINGGEDVLTIGYEELIAPMIKAIQELSARIVSLEQQIQLLKK